MPKNEFMKESAILRTLTLPFRSMRVIIFAILILFGTTVILQTYFHKQALLAQELQLAQQLGLTKPITGRLKAPKTPLPEAQQMAQEEIKPPLNISITRHTYRGFQLIFFKLLRLDGLSGNFAEHIQNFDDTLKVISMRIGNIAIYLFFTIYLSIIALIDGLNARKIRQANAARESASLYHRAKFLRTGILWSSVFIYLTLPITINPQWLLIPVIGIAVSIFVQAKYLKKYL